MFIDAPLSVGTLFFSRFVHLNRKFIDETFQIAKPHAVLEQTEVWRDDDNKEKLLHNIQLMRVGVITIRLRLYYSRVNCTHFHAYLFDGILWIPWRRRSVIRHAIQLDRITKHPIENIAQSVHRMYPPPGWFDCGAFDLILLSDASQSMMIKTLFVSQSNAHNYS